jgi:hypothetical protein
MSSKVDASVMADHADTIEEALGMLHAALLHIAGEVKPPSPVNVDKAVKLAGERIASIREVLANMRRPELGLE